LSLVDRLQSALGHRYRIERELGRGGMATVYLAEDLKHQRRVALKVLRPELGAALGGERFLREIATCAALQHPHILGLLDSGEIPPEHGAGPGLLFYAMPYVEGESLRDLLNRKRQLPLDEAITIAREVADALGYAHTQNVVHRDIKPENILLSAGHAVVADFGIAKALTSAGGEKLTETGLALGTPYYMSPEQATGDPLDGSADQYALGCVLYEMLAGTPPFQGSTAQSILARHAVDPVPSLRTVRGTIPLGVEQAISRALAKSPADRFATAAEFAEALENGRRQPPVSQVRTRHLALIAGLLILVASAGVAYSVRSRLGPSPLTSLAIAPFENLTGDSAQVYLAQGMTEQLIADLSRIAALKVIRLGQVPTQDSAIAIARDLKLGGVLGGSLQRAGTAVRITVRLVSPATGQAVWGESQEGELARVFDLQERFRWEIRENNYDFNSAVRSLTDDNWFEQRFRIGVMIKPSPWIKLYAQGQDYHDIVKKGLKALARWLVAKVPDTDLKVFVDTAPVMEKPLAEAAGLGWQGKHTNLVSREEGSWLLLGAIMTTLELKPDAMGEMKCGSCSACLAACPTDAFPAPFKLDARRCISYLTIEHKGPIPHEFREAIGNRIYGCDDCLAVCPWNKFADAAAANRAFAARAELAAPELGDLLQLDDASFRQIFSGSPIKRIGRDRMTRNALIAAGNSGLPDLLPRVTALLDDPAPVVRGAAAWALARLDPKRFAEEAAGRGASEEDADVRGEWMGLGTIAAAH